MRHNSGAKIINVTFAQISDGDINLKLEMNIEYIMRLPSEVFIGKIEDKAIS